MNLLALRAFKSRWFKPFHHNTDARSNGSTSLTMSGISRSIALRSLS
jgi:hypothetical protein